MIAHRVQLDQLPLQSITTSNLKGDAEVTQFPLRERTEERLMARIMDNCVGPDVLDPRILARSHGGADGKHSIAGKLWGESAQ